MKLYKSFIKLAAAIIVFTFCNLYAQDDKPPLKWGDIPKADLEMKSFPKDTNATAFILCDYGESHFNNDFEIVCTRYIRIKIFDKKGYDWGTHSVSLYTEDNTERISGIEGATYSLEDNGKISVSKLNESDIFEEKTSKSRTRYKFTLPNLKPGCIIEIRYKIFSTSIAYMRNWLFQSSEPVRWSEYKIRFPRIIGYSAVTLGFEPYAIQESRDVTQVFDGTALSYVGQRIGQCHEMHWAVKDMPAVRDEPYMTNLYDYLNRVDIQLAGYTFGGITKKVLTDWPSLINELLELKYFGERIDDTGDVTDLAKNLTEGLNTTMDKVSALYNWVSKSIVAAGSKTLYADQDVDDVIESKKGNTAEKTFLFLSLLKSIGIKGEPVILSTHENGQVQTLFPIISQFNYVLARVQIDSKYYYMSPTNSMRPMDLLPTDVLNVRGLVIKEGQPEWVTITSDKQDKLISTADIKLSEDGSVNGTFEDSYFDYGNLTVRGNINEKGDKEIAKVLFDTDKNNAEIDSLEIENRDSLIAPLKITAEFNSPTYAQANGDMIYINPQIIHRLDENPFKKIERKFPVDYTYKRSYANTVNLTIPDGFEIKENIKDKSTRVSGGAAVYNRTVKTEGDKITIHSEIEINSTQVEPKLYQQLRYFYTTVVSIQSEQIVLARKKTELGSN